MHTFKIENSKFYINYNSDYSGDIIINDEDGKVCVPIELLISFIADMYRQKEITKLENMPNDEILNRQFYSNNEKENAFYNTKLNNLPSFNDANDYSGLCKPDMFTDGGGFTEVNISKIIEKNGMKNKKN